jgi:hypothetical protein
MKPITEKEKEVIETKYFPKKAEKEKTFQLRPIKRIRNILAFKDIIITEKAKNEKEFLQKIIKNNKSTNLADFKKFDLSGEKYENINFSASYFSNCNLTNVIFKNCNMENAWFLESNLTNITFINCNLIHLRVYNCELERSDFSYNDLRGAYMGKYARCEEDYKFNFDKVNLTGSNIFGAEFGNNGQNRIEREKFLIDMGTPFEWITPSTFAEIVDTPKVIPPPPKIQKMSDKQKLARLRKDKIFVSDNWKSLDDVRYCLHCNKKFTGRDIIYYEGSGFQNCPTEGCDGSPLDWSEEPWD